ncbi:MAG: hypothetical protein KF819_25865 [Labilithrix sp.]|nr:hypothetical protein [Labilithrix sp.]
MSIVSLVVAVASCGSHSPTPATTAAAIPEEPAAVPLVTSTDGRVVLVTLDGARWQDVFDAGIMSRTAEIVAKSGIAFGADAPRGASCGIVRTASGANVSLPGYLEIFTGRATSCADNACAPIEEPTLLDAAATSVPGAVASIGSWEMLDRAVSNGSSRAVVATGRRAWPGARLTAGGRLDTLVGEGLRANAYPGVGAYRPDTHTAAIALEYFRVATPVFLHVGLGDMDEWAHRGDHAAYVGAMRDADAFIGELADTLASMGAIGARTTVIVTADHGRNADFRHHGPAHPESARVFVIAFGARVEHRGVSCAPRDLTLADVAPTIRVLLGLEATEASLDRGRPIDGIVAREPRYLTGARASEGAAQRP